MANEGREKRSAKRHDLIKLAFVKDDAQSIGCLLQDVSLAGARVEFVNLPGVVPPLFDVGTSVQFVVDEMGEAPGIVTRVERSGLALRFDGLDAAETEFVSNLRTALEIG